VDEETLEAVEVVIEEGSEEAIEEASEVAEVAALEVEEDHLYHMKIKPERKEQFQDSKEQKKHFDFSIYKFNLLIS